MNWHARYLQQATWTRDLRTYLFDKAGLARARHVLEVGCGTGAVLRELASPASLHGLDIDPVALTQALSHAANVTLIRGDGLSLPYINQTFDIVYCHYFLLWVDDPLQTVMEMKRVTKPGGHILALAEPDYFARVDEPYDLKMLGQWQRDALKRQGANPGFGSQLAEVFFQAGIQLKETGTIQGTSQEPSVQEREMEWAVIEADLAGIISGAEIQKMKELDDQAWVRGERVLHVPTYFAWGQM